QLDSLRLDLWRLKSLRLSRLTITRPMRDRRSLRKIMRMKKRKAARRKRRFVSRNRKTSWKSCNGNTKTTWRNRKA
ncbi:hypothetical protein BGZ58_004588, partial [Dissophora ornata]